MDKIFRYNSRQPLVHRDCHQLPKPNMGAPHVLSISPILVIDDNHFQESLYKELCITMQCNNQWCMRMGCKCLGTKTKARRKLRRILHKTLWNSSPIGIDCQNGWKAKKTNIKGVPPKLCISQQESGMPYTYPKVILGWRPTILRLQDCKRMICHKDITKRETSNQAINRYQLKRAIKIYQLNQLDQRSYVPQE